MKSVLSLMFIIISLQANPALLQMTKQNYPQAARVVSSSAKTPMGRETLLLKARAYFLNEQYSKAIECYSDIISHGDTLEPAFIKSHFGVAESYAAQNRFQEAEKFYRDGLDRLTSDRVKEKIAREFRDEAAEIFDDSSDVTLNAAISYLKIAQMIIQKGPLFEEIFFLLGEVSFHKKDYGDAQRYYSEFTEKFRNSPRYFEAIYKGAVSANHCSREGDAREGAFKILSNCPNDSLKAEALLLLSESYHMPHPGSSEDLYNGIDALSAFIDHYPNHPSIDQARYDIAIATLSAPCIRPTLTDSLSSFYIEHGIWDNKRSEILFNKALSLLYQARDDEAVKAFESFINAYPYSRETQRAHSEIESIWWKRGERAFMRKQWQDAVFHFKKYIERYPEQKRSGEAHFRIAQSWQKLDEVKKAEEQFRLVSSKFHSEKWGKEAYFELVKMKLKRDPSSKEVFALLENNREHLGEMAEKVLDNWGDTLLQILPGTPFLSSEEPYLKTKLRNIDSISLSIYDIDEELFFRDQLTMKTIPEIAIELSSPKIKRMYIPQQAGTKTAVPEKIPLPIEKAGVYLIKLRTGNREAVTTLSVSDIRAVMKDSPRGTLLFVENVTTGKPVSGAEVLISDNREIIYEAKTDKRGICFTDIRTKRNDREIYSAFVKSGDHSTWITPVPEIFPEDNGEKATVRILTDKRIYTESDTVHIMVPPYSSAYTLSVADSAGTVIFRKALPASHSMTHLSLPPHRHHRGSYNITLKDSSETITAAEFYDITAEQPVHKIDSYTLSSELNDTIFHKGDTMKIQIKLSSKLGKPVANKLVEIDSYSSEIAADTVFTDQNGEAAVRIPLNTLSVNSTTTSISITVPSLYTGHYKRVHLINRLFEMKSTISSNEIYPGDRFQLRITGSSRIKEGVTQKASLKTYQKTARGEKLISERQITIAIDTTTEIEMKADSCGSFRTEVTSRDSEGNLIYTESKFFVKKLDPGKEYMKITLSDTLFTPEETLSATIESNLNGHILFTFESDSLIAYHIHKVTKENEKIELPLQNSMVPNVTLTATAIADHKKLLTFKKNISISKELTLSIEPHDTIKAGDTLTLKIAVNDAKKRGKSSLVSLFVTENQSGKELPRNLYKNYYRPNQHRSTVNRSEQLYTTSMTAKEVGALRIVESDEVAGMKEFRTIRKKLTKQAKEEYARGIGFGSGTGSGFGGDAGGVDDLLGSLMGGGGSTVQLKKRSCIKAQKGMKSTSWTATSISCFSDIPTDEKGIATVKLFIPDSICNGIVINAFANDSDGYIGSENRICSVVETSFDREKPALKRDDEKLYRYSFSLEKSENFFSSVYDFIRALPINLSLYREHPLYGIYLKSTNGDEEHIRSNLITVLTGGREPLLSSDLKINRENFITAIPFILSSAEMFTPWLVENEKIKKLLPAILEEVKKEDDNYLRLKLLLTVARIDSAAVPAVTLHRMDRLRDELSPKSQAVLGQLWLELGRRDKYLEIRPDVVNTIEENLEKSTPDADELIHSLELLIRAKDESELLKRGGETLVTEILPQILNSPNQLTSVIALLKTLYSDQEQNFSISRHEIENIPGKIEIKRQFIPFKTEYMGQNLNSLSAIIAARADTTIDGDTLSCNDFLAVKIFVDSSQKEALPLVEKIPEGFSYVASALKEGFVDPEKRELSYLCSQKDTIIYIVKAEAEGAISFISTKLQNYLESRPGQRKEITVLPETGNLIYCDLPEISEKRGDIARYNRDNNHTLHYYEKAAASEKSIQLLEKLLFTSIEQKDNERIVNYFEEIKERNPDQLIPFDKLAVVQNAYREMSLFESGLNLNRGIAESRFIQELNIVGKLEKISQEKRCAREHERLNSLPVIKRITTTYPYSESHAKSLYLFAHLLYDRVDKTELTQNEKTELLTEIEVLLSHYLGEYRESSRRNAALYTRASASLDKNDLNSAATWCSVQLDDSTKSGSYVTALNAYASFLKKDYSRSKTLAEAIINSTSEYSYENSLGKYILAQIHHGTGNLAEALKLYGEVAYMFSDAGAITEAGMKRELTVSELTTLSPNESAIPVSVTNIDTVTIRSYAIDPVAFLQREGTLQKTSSINLSGIKPSHIRTVVLVPKLGVKQDLHLNPGIAGNGVYLTFIHAGDLTLSTIVVKGAVELAVQQNSSRGIQVSASSKGKPLGDADILICGNDSTLIQGKGDTRGIFNYPAQSSTKTVIVRKDNEYGIFLANNQIKTASNSPKLKKTTHKPYKNPADFFTKERVNRKDTSGNFFNQRVEGVKVNQILQ